MIVRRGLSICLLAFALAAPARAAEAPDLVLELPTAPYGSQAAPVYVDPFEQPGRLLYRFDAVITNRGGTLDLFRDRATGHVIQAVWRNGVPDAAPDPNVAPSGPNATLVDRSATGARFEYAFERTHNHWHFFSAARYALEVPGEAARGGKIGFCMFDSFGPPTYFTPWDTGAGSQTWCGFYNPEGDFVRMGLSPGASDRYAAPREFQWVDMTDLRPGAYVLRATVNPQGEIVESDTSNNVADASRTIPGVIASDRNGEQHADGSPVVVALSGTVVAPDVPVRASANCEPSPDSAECYRWSDVGSPVTFRLVRAPQHGTVRIDAASATATYEPAPGYRGADAFDYEATDDRGLISPAAHVKIAAVPAESPPGSQQTAPSPGPPAIPVGAKQPAAHIIVSASPRKIGRRWTVRMRLSTRAHITASLRCGARTVAIQRRQSTRGSMRLRLTASPRANNRNCRVVLTARVGDRRERLTLRLPTRSSKRAAAASLFCRLAT